MQNISIKAGTSATISLTPKIGDSPATASQLAGVTVYVFFVYQFTNKVYGNPYALTAGSDYDGKLTINLSPSETIEMLGTAESNQKYELQFAMKDAEGNIIADSEDSNILVNIIRWEAGSWLQQNASE